MDVLTLGQYLRPTENHLAVIDNVTPECFEYDRQLIDVMQLLHLQPTHRTAAAAR